MKGPTVKGLSYEGAHLSGRAWGKQTALCEGRHKAKEKYSQKTMPLAREMETWIIRVPCRPVEQREPIL